MKTLDAREIIEMCGWISDEEFYASDDISGNYTVANVKKVEKMIANGATTKDFVSPAIREAKRESKLNI